MIKVKYISLVNLVMDREVVTELIQDDLTTQNLIESLEQILEGAGREKIKSDYKELVEVLGGAGASANTASLMLKTLSEGL